MTNVNEGSPIFTDGDTTTRSVAENTASGQNIGDPVAATDVDTGDTLVYTLSGDDAVSFSIVSTSGQLQTNAALDYETTTSYSVTITVSDGSLTDNITVTINVTNVLLEPPVNQRTQQVQDAIVAAIRGIYSADDVTAAHLATITALDLYGRSITSLKSGDFDGLTSLGELYIYNNSISDISALENLTSLTNLSIFDNSISDISALEDLTSLAYLWLRNNSISDISVLENLTSLTKLDLRNNSISDISALEDLTALTHLYLSGNPILDYGPLRRLKAANNSINIDIDVNNNLPVFTDGSSTTRSVAENTASGQNIGNPVAATDVDSGTTLVYTLSGDDAASFSIVSTSGQLQTKAALDYETKSSYTVTVTAYDGNSGADRITVTIDVTDTNDPPTFSDGSSTTRSVAENTTSGTNIGAAVAATDSDTSDILIYSLEGTDASSFSIVSTSGQLQTKAALDYETQTSYSVIVSVSDNNGGSDSIDVIINVTDTDEVGNDRPTFTEGSSTTRSVAENTAANTNIGDAVAATDSDSGDILRYTLGGADAASFSIVSTTGQLRTKAALDYETDTSYSVTITVSDGSLEDNIDVTIDVTNVNEAAPVFTDGSSTTRSVAENTASNTNIGDPVDATDADTGDVLVYTLGGDDAASFSIVSTTGQLQTKTALDYETKISYAVTVSVSDGNGGSDSITVTINVTDVADFVPVNQRTQQVQDAIVAAVPGVNNANDVTEAHVAAITVLDLSGQSITSLKSGDFYGFTALTTLQLHNNSISDISVLEDLTALTSLTLNDNSISDISVLEDLTTLTELTLNDNSISDVSALEDLTALTDLDLSGNPILDYGPLSRLKTANPSVDIDINLNNNLPVFSDGNSITRSVAENTAASTNIGAASAATDADNHTLTYTLGGTDAASFSIVSTTGQLQTKAKLDYETKTSYSVTVTAYDGNSGADRITVTIKVTNVNEKPSFPPGRVILAVAENTASNTNIGDPITATDPDNGDTLTYSLQRGDARFFSIDANTGQVKTRVALDYESKNSYTNLAVRAVDSGGLRTSTLLTINVTNVPGAPPSVETPAVIPDHTDLLTNFPNPFNPETWIPYQLAKPADVTLTIYNMRGVVVRTIALGHKAAGLYTNRSRAIHWDGRNSIGEKVATGVYFYTLKAGDFTATRKMLIRK